MLSILFQSLYQVTPLKDQLARVHLSGKVVVGQGTFGQVVEGKWLGTKVSIIFLYLISSQLSFVHQL